MEDELNVFLEKMEKFANESAPPWMSTNSYFVSITHDNPIFSTLKIAWDFQVSNREILNMDPLPETGRVKSRLEVVRT